jgi:N-acyl homoserine lactone hydrolase
MEVHRLIAGHITSPAGLWRQGDSMEEPLRFPVPVYLVETAAARVLVDTGLAPAAVADVRGHYGLERFELEQDASIAELVELSSLTHVVLTHLHFDHAGGMSLLPPGVPVIVQQREWRAGHDAAAIARNFLQPRDYADREVVTIDGEHDLLGDGSIRLMPTPGHTAGHQSVWLTERLLIGGDVVHFASGLDDLRFPVFADDHAAQAESARRLRAHRDAGVTVTPGHDPAVITAGPVLTTT